MSRTKIEVYEYLYEFAFVETKKAAAGVAPDKRLHQVKPGGAHPLWLLGHLTFSTDAIVNAILLGGEMTLPEQYQRVFAPALIGGDAIVPEAAAYPSWDDIAANYARVSATTLDLLKRVQDGDLPGGTKGTTPPGFADFFKSFEIVLRYMLQHDAYHRGQMMALANA